MNAILTRGVARIDPAAVQRRASGAFNRPERPMLSRVADATYWMSRYVERAEHASRLLTVVGNLLTDVGDAAPALVERQWVDLLHVFHQHEDPPGGGPMGPRVRYSLTFEENNPASLVSVIGRARENARSIRSEISAEMWAVLNELYWSTRGDDARSRFEDHPEEYLTEVMRGCMLFHGLTDQTLAHDQRWHFARVGQFLERLDVTCRVIETRHAFLIDADRHFESPIRNIHLMAALRMCCSIEAYRRLYLNELDMLNVAAFLILEKNHPRSVRFTVEQARQSAAAVREATAGPRAAADPAERILGRLAAQLEYAEVQEILDVGLSTYLTRLRESGAAAAAAVRQRYFPT